MSARMCSKNRRVFRCGLGLHCRIGLEPTAGVFAGFGFGSAFSEVLGMPLQERWLLRGIQNLGGVQNLRLNFGMIECMR